MTQPPGEPVTYGRYRVERQIGQGGMGVVHAANDTVLNRTVALKVVSQALAGSPDFRARFGREAEALARLDSPHIIAIYDHGEQDGVPYIATQFVPGGDLSALLRQRGPMPVPLAASVCAQVADALGDAHRIGIVHRDVKASNVLVRDPEADEPHVYLCDFGIAKADGDDLTQPGGVAGSWAYLSPERATGQPASPASDVYATGCLLWVCLSGTAPYGGSDAEVILAHQRSPVPQLPGDDELTSSVNAVLGRAMAKDPAQRYPDAASLRADLLAISRGGTPTSLRSVAATDPGPTVVPGGPAAGDAGARAGSRRRRPALLAAGVALVLVVAAAILVPLLGGGDDDDPGDPAESATGLITGDLDDNGFGDVVMTQDRADSGRPAGLLVWPSNGSSLGAGERRERPGEGPLHLADVDGDGLLDEVAEGPSPFSTEKAELTVQPGDGSDPWTSTVPVPYETFGVFIYDLFTDVDDDGDDDLVISANSPDGRTGLYVARSDGTSFGETEQWYAGTENWSGAEFFGGDFAGDGRGDVLVTREGDGGETWTIYTDDDGAFTTSDAPPYVLQGRPGRALGSPLTGDFDGDGADEIALFGGAGRAVSHFDVVDGVVQPFDTWLSGLDAGVADTYGTYTVTDLDGDGLDDLVWLRREDDGTGPGELLGIVSTGESFEDPTPWGAFDCGEECGDTYRFALSG